MGDYRGILAENGLDLPLYIFNRCRYANVANVLASLGWTSSGEAIVRRVLCQHKIIMQTAN